MSDNNDRWTIRSSRIMNARITSIRIVLLFALLLCVRSLSAATPTGAFWEEENFVVRFDDSVSYAVDLGATDSSQLVIRIDGAEISDTILRKAIQGPQGFSAALTRGAGRTLLLTIKRPSRFGYSTLYRPYSRRLVVHTFDWNDLTYAEEQYQKGLLALEQNLPDQAEEYLSTAYSFGDRRAGSVLALHFLNTNRDSLAATYLRAPHDPDDYRARAELKRRAGDTAGAGSDEAMFERALARLGSGSPGVVADAETDDEGSAAGTGIEESDEHRSGAGSLFEDWRGVALVLLGALAIILLAVWFSRRTPSGPINVHRDDHPASRPTDTAVYRTESTEPERAPPPAPATVAPREELRKEPAPTVERTAAEQPSVPPPIDRAQPDRPATPRDPETKAPVSDAAVLPRPDALPDDATTADVQRVAPTDEIQEATPFRRSSAQAEQLRQRMESARQDDTTASGFAPSKRPAGSDDETTLSEARRLNVSRDYVELRDRIARLRDRIERNEDR